MRNVEVGILFAVATLAERGVAEFRIPIGQRYLMASTFSAKLATS